MSLLLVLAAAVALVIGLLQSGLAIIYVSIGCSVVAGILLAVAVVRGRPDKAASTPLPQPAPQPASQPWAGPQPAPQPHESAPAMAGAPALSDSTQQLDQAAIELAVLGDDDHMPIADYDRLRATEVLPLLANLDADELGQIRVHEAAGRNRFMVLSRIDRELEGRGVGGEAADDAAADDGPPSDWDSDDEWDGSVDAATDDDAADEPEVRSVPARATASGGSMLDNYEQLKVLEILPRLAELNADELAQVRRREQSGQRRAMIINRVDRLIVDARPAASARGASAAKTVARKAPAKRAPAKKAAVKKAPAKRAVATKAAVKKAPAKKAVVKKAAVKKAPAKKAVAKTTKATKKR